MLVLLLRVFASSGFVLVVVASTDLLGCCGFCFDGCCPPYLFADLLISFFSSSVSSSFRFLIIISVLFVLARNFLWPVLLNLLEALRGSTFGVENSFRVSLRRWLLNTFEALLDKFDYLNSCSSSSISLLISSGK
mgnify:FL=1